MSITEVGNCLEVGEKMKDQDIRIGQEVVCLPRVLGKLWKESEWFGKVGKVKDATVTQKPLYKIEIPGTSMPYWAKAYELERVKE